MKNKPIKKGIKIILGILILLVVITGAFLIYASDYYHADETAVDAASINGAVTITNYDGALIFDPENADTALVFYPGGKVEYTAYEPLMLKIAQSGILCILTEMPLNLAVFDINAADNYITTAYPDINHWYVGGHSLGGSMAASFAGKNADIVEGLVLLASYSTADLSASKLRVLSIYGSDDKVLNADSYATNASNLPKGFTELVIQGGNHAGFGCYGVQKGDGEASITPDEQQTQTAKAIASFCFGSVS